MIIKKVKFLKLKDSSFIIIPKPFEDELLSSWLVRTAYAHHLHPHTFIKMYLGYTTFNANLDVTFSDKYLSKILKKIKKIFDVYKMSLNSYSGYLQENIIDNGFNKMLCNQRFCPVCLREDSIVYFRKQWKILFNTVCLKHKCYLYESCPKCNSKIRITRMYKNEKSFQYCSNCGFDLSTAREIAINKIDNIGLIMIERLNIILDKGYLEFDRNIVYSFIYFETLLQFGKLILCHNKTKFIEELHFFKYLKLKKYKSSINVFHQIPIKESFSLFFICDFLFRCYPENLKNYFKANNLSHWASLKDMEDISFWLDNLINKLSPRIIYPAKLLTNEEILNAKTYLKMKKIEINKSNMTKLLGANFFSCYNKLEL